MVAAVTLQVVFGLSSSERVVAEVRCCLAGPSKALGRMVVTQVREARRDSRP